MRAATILQRARSGLRRARPWGILAGLFVAGVLLAALVWFWPTAAAAVGLCLLIGCGSKIAALRLRVRELSDRDPLTGAASRACFSDRLRRAHHKWALAGAPVSVAVLDCDGFKQINERFGHAVGDAVLIEVADVLAHTVPRCGTVGRLWGDAFGILLPGLSLEAARDLLREAEEHLQIRMAAHHWPLTFSIGVSCDCSPIASADELLSHADALMFSVKRRGRNGLACRPLHEESNAAAGCLPADAPLPAIGLPDHIRSASPEFARQP